MHTFIMLFSNGYNLEYDCEIDAISAKEARKAWLKSERGSYKERAVLRDPKNLRATKKI